MRYKWIIIIGLLLAIVAGVYATATQTITTGITGGRSRVDWQRGRYAQSDDALRRLVIAVDANTDGSATTDSNIVGYLERVTYYADGNAPSFDVNITDTDGYVLYAQTAANSASDPYSVMITLANSAGTHFRGVPFAGALTVKWANLDDGPGCTTKNLGVVIYYREEWQ